MGPQKVIKTGHGGSGAKVRGPSEESVSAGLILSSIRDLIGFVELSISNRTPGSSLPTHAVGN